MTDKRDIAYRSYMSGHISRDEYYGKSRVFNVEDEWKAANWDQRRSYEHQPNNNHIEWLTGTSWKKYHELRKKYMPDRESIGTWNCTPFPFNSLRSEED